MMPSPINAIAVDSQKNRLTGVDRIIAAIAAAAGVFNLFKDLQSWVGYALLAMFLWILVPYIRAWITGARHKSLRANAVEKFQPTFRGLVVEASEFMLSTNTHSLPYYIRSHLDRNEFRDVQPTEHIEHFFAAVVIRLKTRSEKKGVEFSEFDDANWELYEYLLTYSRIYVSSFVQSLKDREKAKSLTATHRTELNTRFQLFRTFLQSYNRYRGDVSRYLNDDATSYLVTVPIETIE
jgi:hypothetical protein